jgi:cell division protein FtsZ
VVVDNAMRHRTRDGGVDYDRPTVIRRQASAAGAERGRRAPEQTDLDYLDIPAFLRRQAD